MDRLVYELRVRGPVPPELLEEIAAENLGEEPPLTILRTGPMDQPALHGVLLRLRSQGVDLLEVRIAAEATTPPAAPERSVVRPKPRS